MLNQRTHERTHTPIAEMIRPTLVIAPDLSGIRKLKEADKQEVLAFLSTRPVHTVAMTSFVNDNGIESELNRGVFYEYRNRRGVIEGIALIGHSTLVEARTEDALKALAFAARTVTTPINLIMSSGTAAQTFWNYLKGFQVHPRLTLIELLFEVGFPFPVQSCEYDVRLARTEELETVAEAHAEVAEIECGVNPMVKDREGFLKRVMRRIEQGRVFVVFDGDKLVFKADIVAETDAVAYLEGVYVGPEFRGKGTGSKCLSALCLELLNKVQNVCLLSNVEFKGAHRSFLKAGMRQTDACTTLFV